MQTGVETLGQRRETNVLSPITRKSVLYGNREGGDNGTSRKANTAVRPNRLHSLDKKEFYNELCVQLKQGSFDVRNNFVSNLYACLKNHPNYNGNLVFTKDMDVNKIVSLIRNEIDSLMPDNAETVIEHVGEDLQVVSYCMHDMMCRQNAMPLRWMLKLKYKNPTLFTIVRNVISLVKGKFLIADWDDGFSADARDFFYESLMDVEDKPSFNEYKKGLVEVSSAEDIKGYGSWYHREHFHELEAKDGVGHLFRYELDDIYKMIDEDWLMDKINTYKPRNPLYIELLAWAKKGMELYYNHNGVTINDLIFVTEDEYEEGSPITAMDFLKFEWDFRCTFWDEGVERTLNDHAGQIGVIDTRAYSVLGKDRYVNNFDEKYELFGKALEEWFEFGTDVYYQHIWNWEER